MEKQAELIIELNQNFNDLGEDLILLESVLKAGQEEAGFPGEYIASSLARTADYVEQHTEAISRLARFLTAAPPCGGRPAGR